MIASVAPSVGSCLAVAPAGTARAATAASSIRVLVMARSYGCARHRKLRGRELGIPQDMTALIIIVAIVVVAALAFFLMRRRSAERERLRERLGMEAEGHRQELEANASK